MSIERGKPPAGLSGALSDKLNSLYGPCIACEECFGLCPSLIEALMLPDAVLKPHGRQSRKQAQNEAQNEAGQEAGDE